MATTAKHNLICDNVANAFFSEGAALVNGRCYRKSQNILLLRDSITDFNQWSFTGVKPVIQPIRAKNIRKKFLSLCCIVTNTEWNGIIKLIIEVKCIRIILSPNLIDLVVF